MLDDSSCTTQQLSFSEMITGGLPRFPTPLRSCDSNSSVSTESSTLIKDWSSIRWSPTNSSLYKPSSSVYKWLGSVYWEGEKVKQGSSDSWNPKRSGSVLGQQRNAELGEKERVNSETSGVCWKQGSVSGHKAYKTKEKYKTKIFSTTKFTLSNLVFVFLMRVQNNFKSLGKKHHSSRHK